MEQQLDYIHRFPKDIRDNIYKLTDRRSLVNLWNTYCSFYIEDMMDIISQKFVPSYKHFKYFKKIDDKLIIKKVIPTEKLNPKELIIINNNIDGEFIKDMTNLEKLDISEASHVNFV